ncbi:glycosyltransferase family 2 protein [Faecalispora jeddahensis]|uniref:glycosyltransferase family 2 protein n=1 Tax=Faecalispora jeddahensis TaxID=1414721 RepID=UPI00145AD0F6|nr:glycosyltransferase [Faecalispora jeddahensis]
MEQESITVSVLMLSYNHVHYIRQALNSILTQQTDFQFEILVGDDASQDGTAQIISDTAQNELQLHPVLRPRNIGATRNLYNLQMRARGAYLAYLEGDDYWCDTHKLQKQVDFLMAHPNYIGCTHRCRMVDELGEPHKSQYLSWISQKERYTLEDFHGFVLPGHASTLMHRNIFLNSDGAYEAIITMHPLIGDRSLSLLLASQGAVYQLSDIMSCYRFSHTAEGRNATAVAYTHNTNRIREDYDYTKKLEAYAFQMLGVDGGFSAHKKSLFVSAVWAAFKHPNTESFQIAAQILREGQPFDYLFALPAGALHKLREKHKQGS